jgi:hypothetical protein
MLQTKYLHPVQKLVYCILRKSFSCFVMLTLRRFWDSHTCRLCDLHGCNNNTRIVVVFVIPILFSPRGELLWNQNSACSTKLEFISNLFSIKEQLSAYNNHSFLLVYHRQTLTDRPKNGYCVL